MYVLPSKVQRRAPRGARGLKFEVCGVAMRNDGRSRPSRGAWIEMCNTPTKLKFPLGRAPRGARGLKFIDEIGVLHSNRRAPRGARGLKYKIFMAPVTDGAVAPHAGRGDLNQRHKAGTEVRRVAPRPGGGDCKLGEHRTDKRRESRAPRGARGLKSLTIPLRDSSISRSRPSRGAWIEITIYMNRLRRSPSRAPRGARGLK